MSSPPKLPSLYEPLPTAVGGRNSRPVAAALNSLLPYPPGTEAPPDETVNNAIRYKGLLLDFKSHPKISDPTSKKGWAGNAALDKSVSIRRHPKRRLPNGNKLTLTKEEQKYVIYEPLLKLWLEYATQLRWDDVNMFPDRAIRMDLHGAPVTVVRARDPGLVGLSGILVAETANTILIVTKKDRAVTIPKNVSVIQIEFDNVNVEIFLPALAFRASERSARKVKKKHMPFI